MTSASYSPALKSAAQVGDWRDAIALIDVMTRASVTDKNAGPDVVCFNYAMTACSKAAECEVGLESVGQAGMSRPNLLL